MNQGTGIVKKAREEAMCQGSNLGEAHEVVVVWHVLSLRHVR